jgi:hypothetical protein
MRTKINRVFAVLLIAAILNPPTISLAQNTEINAALDAQIELMKKQTPLEIDEITKMTNVMWSGLGITYYYEVKMPEATWTPLLREAAFQRFLKANCLNSKNTRMLLDHGYSLRHVVLDEQGKFVTNVLITKDKCPP